MRPTKILFIGNFYAAKGTHNIGSKIISKFSNTDYETSYIKMPVNPILRIGLIVWKLCTSRFDIIHLEVYSGRYFLLIVPIVTTLAKLRAKKIFMNIAGGAMPEYHTKHPAFVEHHLSQASVLVSPSKRIIKHLSKTKLKQTIEYLPNFIDLTLFPRATQRQFHYSILWVRAFSQIYNPLIAIQAIELLVVEFPDIHLTMIGPDDGLLEHCNSYIKQHQLEKHITIKGSIPNKELFTYYQSHDVYINTTSYESFGFALIEAACCGLPIVSSNVGEIPMLWTDGDDILLFEDKQPEMLANGVRTLFKKNILREQIANNAYNLAQQFGWEPFLSKFSTLLRSAKKNSNQS